MPSFPVPKARRSKRVVSKLRGSLIINLDRKQERFPCLVLDSSKDGFRLRGTFHLRPGKWSKSSWTKTRLIPCVATCVDRQSRLQVRRRSRLGTVRLLKPL